MKQLTKSTKSVKQKEIKRDWHLIDANEKIVGRLASTVAKFLIGKNKVNAVPYLDSGDYVVIINARRIVMTGNKEDQKMYARYSGYPGGLRYTSFSQMKQTQPEKILRHAVYGMLPKNKLRDKRITRLYIYPDGKHPFEKNFN